MGAKNLDRIPAAAWRQRIETVADFIRDHIEVITDCPRCGLQMVVNLPMVARVSGPETSLWNRKPRCRKLGCGGRATLKAKLPGKGYYEALEAPWPSDKPAAPSSPTLGALAVKEARVHISCRNPSCDHMKARHYGLTLPAVEAAQRWGDNTTLVQLRPKVKCKLCGARWPNVEIEVSTPAAKMGAGASSDPCKFS